MSESFVLNFVVLAKQNCPKTKLSISTFDHLFVFSQSVSCNVQKKDDNFKINLSARFFVVISYD